MNETITAKYMYIVYTWICTHTYDIRMFTYDIVNLTRTVITH